VTLEINSVDVRICWHLADSNSLLFHNAFLGKGWAPTASSLVQQFGSGFTTPYQVRNVEQEKEAVWERVRLQEASQAPSRLGSLYLFETESSADAAQTSWFIGQRKIKVKVFAFPPPIAKLHRADSTWLNEPQPQWENAARSYWRGLMSPEPMVELLAHGCLFFPGWETAPFGLMTPVPPGLGITNSVRAASWEDHHGHRHPGTCSSQHPEVGATHL
jgi:hypothetical protein